MPYVYMVHCADGSIYTGCAKDIRKRLSAHYYRTSACARYTAAHPVVALAALWETDSLQTAAKLEYRIKRLSSFSKRQLITEPETLLLRFPELCGFSFIYHLGARLEDFLLPRKGRPAKGNA